MRRSPPGAGLIVIGGLLLLAGSAGPVVFQVTLVAAAALGLRHQIRRPGRRTGRTGLAGPRSTAGLGRAVVSALGRLAHLAGISPSTRAPEPFGRDASGRAVHLGRDQLGAHALLLGASGAGKTTSLLRLVDDSAARGEAIVVIDLKGSPALTRQLAETSRARALPFRLWTPEGPSVWNPLTHGNPTELKDKLIAGERFSEPHYQRIAERHLQLVLNVAARTARGLGREGASAPTGLEQVVGLLDPSRLLRGTRGLDQPEARRIADYLAALTPDAVSAIRGLTTRLALLTESEAGRWLQPSGAAGGAPEIDLHGALTGGGVTLFSLNSGRYGKLAGQLGTMVVQDLVAASGRMLESGTRVRATVAIDEFSALGADQILGLFARGREAGLSVILATQELSDLDRAGRGLRDQILGNTALKIAHRQDVPASAELVSRMAGVEARWELTDRPASSPWGKRQAVRQGMHRKVERPLVHPDEVKRLRTGQAVVIAKVPRAGVSVVQVAPPDRGAGR